MKLPSGWASISMDELGEVQAGRQRNPNISEGELRPYLRVANVQDGWIDFSDVNEMHFSSRELPIYELRQGDILLAEGQSLELVGRPAVYRGELPGCCFQNTLVRLRPRNHNPEFCYYICYWLFIRGAFRRIAKQTTSIAHLGVSRFAELFTFAPTLSEQQKIADILSTWDEALEKLDALIAAKERNYLATLERLLRAFDTTQIKVNEVTSESGPRNRAKIVSRVLSVTNTKGFVLSKDYFDRQVASSDTSSYKIVRRGEFAYNPSRINVGSIARLDDWNEGLVSPIYVVFALNNRIEPDYFYHWLNSHEARSRIRRSAQGSVRDSVNYDDFGSIRLPLPKRSTQKAISEYLNIAQRELRLLRDQRAAVDQQKRGLMQKLLTGKVRVST